MRRKYFWLLPFFAILAAIVFYQFRHRSPSENTPAVGSTEAEPITRQRSFVASEKTGTLQGARTTDVSEPVSSEGSGQKGAGEQITEKAWEAWTAEQGEVLFKFAVEHFYKNFPGVQKLEPSQLEAMRAEFMAQAAARAAQLKKEGMPLPPITAFFKTKVTFHERERYTGPQTVRAVMEHFDEGYSRHHTNLAADSKYPRTEWIAMLHTRGITLETVEDYWRYLDIRHDLVDLESDPGFWCSEAYGIPPTDDWSTYRAAYTERKIWETAQLQHAQKADPRITGGSFGGPDHRTFLPTKHNTLYVKRKRFGASFHGSIIDDTQAFNILFKGIEPAGYDVIYLDSEDNVLSEPPPPITREEMLNAGRIPPPEAWWDGDFSEQAPADFRPDFSSVQPEPERPRFTDDRSEDVQRRDREESTQDVKEMLDTLTKGDSEIEKTLTQQFGAEFPDDAALQETLRNTVSPERFNRAVTTLNRYGPEEGMRLLRESDPAVARHLERYHRKRSGSD